MLSQVRGPEAARKYLVEKERVRVRGSVGLVAGEASQEQDLEQVQEQEQEQEVFVLVGGFEAWQRL